MESIAGFTDRYAGELRRRRYLAASFARVAESFGFEPLEVPVVENADAYDERVVGLSPWPEWNPKGVFELAIPRYVDAYDDEDGADRAVLIPEGTLSVTRWLAAELRGTSDPANADGLPRKIYYEVACYRNELLSTLSPQKGRQFTQFGIEVLGSGDILSELETISIAAEGLRSIGVSDAAIAFRISSNALFSGLAAESGLDHPSSIELKEALDTIAECKAGKRAERLEGTVRELLNLLEACNVSSESLALWQYIVDRPFGPVTDRDRLRLGDAHAEHLDRIDQIARAVAELGVRVDVDFCVVRSHEYYTGVTFEIDLVSDSGERAVEVGGGGRYDRLMGNFLQDAPGAVVPCSGYAFGLERLSHALQAAEQFAHAVAGVHLEDEPAPHLDLNESTPSAYIASVNDQRERRLLERVSVKLPR
ncbi:ATP phosphoribosyltransferase regulatory subunit [Svornostia abyssi]|uniref:ATP phosphoribosyltransferase regulatory subunit n=1 Tax=Svornostia abyssi TaxID=2898438 RepID=A0ABY5PLZ5_9ACTN|nr:ATP phosphoribosyltransferase regulatory subunit [Parviterribacteraceae bacterium J379]